MKIRTIIDCKPGEFYELAGLYFLPTREIAAGQDLLEDQKLAYSGMFEVWFVQHGGVRCGYVFKSHFETHNKGAYLLTRLRNKGPATEVEVLAKNDDLVLYHYPNIGTLAISPLVNSEIETIFVEQ